MRKSELLTEFFDNNMASLGSAIGVSRQAVYRWGDRIPAERVIPICKALNWKVTPHRLRADLYPNGLDAMPIPEKSNE